MYNSAVKLFCIVILTAALTLLSAPAYGFAGGTGTPEDPYQISTQADLEAVNDDLSACYILINDIDLTAAAYTTAVIASDTDNTTGDFQGTPFTGTFDGNGCIISNMTINTAGANNDYLGMF